MCSALRSRMPQNNTIPKPCPGSVEDDIFCDLQVKTTPRLTTLDQLDRVIYARSFSKTLCGSLRVGFVACSQNVANELADIKMLTSITTGIRL